MEKIKAVVFDLDGTLVDSLQDIATAVNTVLTRYQRPEHSLDRYRQMVGWGLRQLLTTASAEHPFAATEFEAVYEELLKVYRAVPVRHSRLYPGIATMVAPLQGRVPLGVFSNKENGMTQTIVRHLLPEVTFQAVMGAKPGVPHKPDPSALLALLGEWGIQPRQTAYLGDSGVDMETAQRAGCVACGAAWGFRDRQELLDQGALKVFEQPSAFAAWILEKID